MDKKNYGKAIVSFADTLQAILIIIGAIEGIVVAVFIWDITTAIIGILCFAVIAGLNFFLAWALSLFIKGFGQLISDARAIRNHFVGGATSDDEDETNDDGEFQENDESDATSDDDITTADINSGNYWVCQHCGAMNRNNTSRCSKCKWTI